MKTIEEIEIDKTFYRREQTILGVERVPYTKRIKRPVKLVDSGRRFGAFVLDSLVVWVIQFLLVFLVLAAAGENLVILFIFQIFSILILPFYYTIMEYKFQQTIGKMAMGYVVIDKYAQRPELSSIVIRSICRYVPFEAFSCLSDRGGWHDRWSKTYVVTKEEMRTLQRLLGTIKKNDELID